MIMTLQEMQVPQSGGFGLAVLGVLHLGQINAASQPFVFVQQFRLGTEEQEFAQRGEKGEGGGVVLVEGEGGQALRERQQTGLRYLERRKGETNNGI